MKRKKGRFSEEIGKLWDNLRNREEVERSVEEHESRLSDRLQLKEDTLERLEKVASNRKINLNEALEEAMESYIRNQTATPVSPRIKEERKERNTLLRLQGLASNRTPF